MMRIYVNPVSVMEKAKRKERESNLRRAEILGAAGKVFAFLPGRSSFTFRWEHGTPQKDEERLFSSHFLYRR